MRIVVIDTAAAYGGAMSILKQFYEYIRENDTRNEWYFILSDYYLEETGRIHILCRKDVKTSGLHKLWFDMVSGHRYIDSLHPDVVLSLQNILVFGTAAPQYVYIHQSIPFQKEKHFSFLKKEEWVAAVYQRIIGRIIKYSARKAKGIIVQTNWMGEAVSEAVGCSVREILVARPNISSIPVNQDVLVNTHQFFYPTNGTIYKNDAVIVRACAELRRRGITDFEVRLTLPEGTYADPNIRCVGRLGWEEMIQAYQSSVLLFPSYIETVGLPLLEAAQAGTTILAADCQYAHETLGQYDRASYFQYYDEGTLADLMQSVMNEPVIQRAGAVSIRPENDWEKVIRFLEGAQARDEATGSS